MSRGFPSMTALLGLLAVAGYQNRDKIAEMLGGLTSNRKAIRKADRAAPVSCLAVSAAWAVFWVVSRARVRVRAAS